MNERYDSSEMNRADDIDLNMLEEELEQQLGTELDDLSFLEEEKEKIGDPDALGETVLNVVWEQFINQIAVTAGEDFIAENHGLNLDLRNGSHIVTPENFERGRIPTHLPAKDREIYQKRYEEYRCDLVIDLNVEIKTAKRTRYNEETKVWEFWEPRANGWRKLLAPDARNKFDTRTSAQMGSAATAKDHTISAAEQIRDPGAAAYVDRKARQDFAKSEVNINDLDSRANSSKGDLTMDEWLNSKRDGKKPSERFDIDEKALRQKDAEARQEYEKMKEKGKKDAVKKGRQSQKEEVFRISGKALRVAFMTLLAALLKEIIGKLILWFKTTERNISTLIDHVRLAIGSFVGKLKSLLVNVTDAVLTTIATSILGPVVGLIKKVFIMLRQGWSVLKEAVSYLKSPENKGKPMDELLPRVGIIVITGLTGISAIALGEVIEKALTSVPGFGVSIPLLGSPASLIGMLMGGIVCGIVGAIAINMINKRIADKQKNDNLDAQIDKKNDILQTQDKLLIVKSEALCEMQRTAQQEIAERHKAAGTQLEGILNNIVDPAISTAQDMNNEQLDDLLQSF